MDLRSGRWAEKLAPAFGLQWQIAGDFSSEAGPECVAYFDALTRAVLLRLWTTYTRIRPVCPDLPEGVEAQEREGFLFILNHSDRAVELAGIVGQDLLSGAECTGHVLLAPRSAMVIKR